MNITELDSYNLKDAVKFHNRLNPRLWDQSEHLLPEVREKLLEIAADFQEFLGVPDLDVVDITISGSNAAYSYTKHSDIDLHLVVKSPEGADEVYQELFNAKKYQYNDMHDIRIHGADVELYVQPADEAPVSLGEYSVRDNKWLQVPKRKRAKIDQSVVKHKYEDLKARIESALKDDDSDRIYALIKKIKEMRQSGLDQHGEFGPENLAYKMLRSQGYIDRLYAAQSAARDRELSLKEKAQPASKPGAWWRLGEDDTGMAQGGLDGDAGADSTWDGVSPDTDEFLSEDDEKQSVIRDFIRYTAHELGIKKLPKIHVHNDPKWSEREKSFGRYVPETHDLHINMWNRHIMDVLRTTAHELAHCRQHETETLGNDAGETGSDMENEAHAVAGIIMRRWAAKHPAMFESSGYIPTAAQANDPRYKMALTVDVHPGETGRQANKMSLKTDAQGKPALLMKTVNLQESMVQELAKEFALLESEVLSEIRMSTASLRQEAAKTGARAGMEFEMIVPDAQGEPHEPDYEPDYDRDQRARSFDDVEEFFYDGDYNSRGDVRSLLNELNEGYQEWKLDQISDDWIREGLDFIRDYVELNDEFDREDALDTARDEIIDANPDLPTESEDFQQLVNARINELEEQFVQDIFDEGMQSGGGRIYEHAFSEFSDDKSEEYDEEQFLRDTYPYMTDIHRNFDIQWPYYYDLNDGESGSASVDEVADEFEEAIGRPVNASASYHGARREAGHYVVEPDGSLDPDNPGDAGLEFVSPPLPIDELLSDLNKVKEWAGMRGCYTNDSTGLHINISVPDYSLDKLDYVKLALLMGDEYVLDLFGRSGNHYAKAATGKIKDALKRSPDLAPALMDKMRGHMEDLATKAIHSGTTDKYTSINTKTGYIEFRSPGGDWLDANFDKIENTLLRFTVALSAAIDPQAYRKEYLKKLYKLLEGSQDKGGIDVLQLFANYSAGELDKAALIRQVRQKQLARGVEKGKITGKMWWRVDKEGRGKDGASIEVVASSENEAKLIAAKEWGINGQVGSMSRADAYPIRPYKDAEPNPQTQFEGPWGIYMTGPERFARQSGEWAPGEAPLYRFPSREAAHLWIDQRRAENPRMRTDIQVREIEPASQSSAQQPAQGRNNYEIYDTQTGARVEAFHAESNAAALSYLEAYQAQGPHNLSPNDAWARYRVRPVDDTPSAEFRSTENVPREGHPRNLVPTGPGPWEIYRISNGETVRDLSGITNRSEAEQAARNALGIRGEAPELYGVRTRSEPIPGSTLDLQRRRVAAAQQSDSGQGGTVDVAGENQQWDILNRRTGEVAGTFTGTEHQAEDHAFNTFGHRFPFDVRPHTAQPAPRPLGAGRELRGWKIVDPQGNTLHEFGGVGNVQSDANAYAIGWLRRNPRFMQSGVEVVPNWVEA